MINRLFKAQSPDLPFLLMIIILVILGLVILGSASGDMAESRFGSSFTFVTHQLLYGILLGGIGFTIALFTPIKFWQKTALILFIGSIVLLILVFTDLGFRAGGSDRWITILGYTFQPSEFVKFTLITYIAAWLSKKSIRRESFVQGFLPLLTFISLVTALLAVQPSTSTAALLFISAFAMYFAAGGKISYMVIAALAAALAFLAILTLGPGYRMERIKGFLNPAGDPLGSGYQLNQTLIALGSGGISGVGYGKSTSKLGFLPEPIGDSIFAVIGEEFGFIGTNFIILILLLFTIRGLAIAKSVRDPFPRTLVIGFITLITLQAFIHVAAVSGIIPFTGVPLPFISYGGTAMIVLLTMCGVIFRISWKGK